MAASSLNVVRVRLYFDYPSPAVSTCRMCWLLIDLNKCRVVADLVSVIREKFDYSRKTCLDLFIEDCYLPPSESIYVVRDNDSIRVKAESLSHLTATESETSKLSKAKKRRRETEEQEVKDEQNSASKKRKESQGTQLSVTENGKKKSKKKKRKEEQAGERQTETAKLTPAAPGPKPQPEKSTKKQQPSTPAFNGRPAARKPKETSSDSSDSSDEEPSKRPTQHPKPQGKVSSGAGPVSKSGSNTGTKRKDSSSLSDSDSGSVLQPPKKPTPAKSLPAKSKPSPANAAVNTKTKPPPKKQAQSSSSDSDSSSSAERPPPKRTPVRIPPPAPSSNPKASASASTAAGGGLKKPPAKKAETSSDSDSSSSSERPPVRKPSATCTPKPPLSAPAASAASSSPAAKPAAALAAKSDLRASDSDSSEEEIELVIRKPVLNGMGLHVAGVVCSSPVVGAGRGRMDARTPGKGTGRGEGRFAARRGSSSRGGGRGSGRGNGTPWSKGFRYDNSDDDRTRDRRFNDSLTNTSLILQNPPEPVPRDYNVLPLLAAPPPVGQKIAFKLLELTENYTPEVSDYKEGKITGFNVITNMVELELLSRPKVPIEPGKFDLVYENPDGSEVVEYAVTQGSQLTERWDSLLEPRLIVENVE
ncbi:coilin [Alosa sapidissima]|uniref:coilin n=1 Tax=Alosa sapidissima TaxID=34773 RepID=UPI001C080D3D|nr:coilin [Alosa sapidissima]